MAIVKVQHKGQLTIPRSVLSAVGLADGDRVEVKADGGKVIVIPQVVIDYSKFPNADDEYTPAQRRVIDRQLAKSLKEYEEGRSFGPFNTHEAFVTSLHEEAAKLRRKKPKRSAK